ncbi:hypothetical protein PsYK624_017030 [Phanerochaete sordida]|uniref:Uncharacterized protein n=1 Tax=Phanerochaete sordida TaxID=48140 RepID=A0A9P3G0T3_9APHY|nr:hypothetical protein PsYK624_017030 [Phanerochaete sordida]
MNGSLRFSALLHQAQLSPAVVAYDTPRPERWARDGGSEPSHQRHFNPFSRPAAATSQQARRAPRWACPPFHNNLASFLRPSVYRAGSRTLIG